MDGIPKRSPALDKALNDLLSRDRAIIDIGKKCVSEDFFVPDVFVISVLNRALQLLHGLVLMVRHSNYISAAPLFRLQLDNGLRMWAASQVESFDVFTYELLKGERIDKMRSRSGERLTDSFLVTSLANFLELPKLPEAYNTASGFIHLSDKHVFASHKAELGRVLVGRISRWDSTTDEEKWLDLINAFREATDIVIYLVNRWSNQKGEERHKGENGPTKSNSDEKPA